MAIWMIIKNSFKQFYDHLFLLVLINLIWFFLITPAIFLGYSGIKSGWFLPLIIPLILFGPFFISGLHITDQVVMGEDIKVKDFFIGIKKYFKRGLSGFLYTFLVYLVLFIDFLFFLQKGNDNKIMLFLAVAWLYLIIFFSMMQLYFWGLLTIQGKTKLSLIIKRSFLLTIDNALFAFLWLLIVVILILILVITGIGLPVLFMSLIGLLINNGTRYTLQKYNEDEGKENNNGRVLYRN